MSSNAPPRSQRRKSGDQDSPVQTSAVARLTPQQEAVKNVTHELERRNGQLLALLHGDQAAVDRLRAVAIHALGNPRLASKLVRADLATVVEAVRESAVLGLSPTGVSGEGYLVPYWNKNKGKFDFQFQPGYQGLVQLLEDTVSITTGVAYENDEFDYELGSKPFVRHRPALVNRGNRVAVYAVATIHRTGKQDVELMTIPEVELARAQSKAADDGPWISWYDEMARKTVLRRGQKRWPKSTRAQRAIAVENEAEERYNRPPAQPEGAKPMARLSRVRDLLGMDAGEAREDDVADGQFTEIEAQAQSGGPVEPASGAAADRFNDESAAAEDGPSAAPRPVTGAEPERPRVRAPIAEEAAGTAPDGAAVGSAAPAAAPSVALTAGELREWLRANVIGITEALKVAREKWGQDVKTLDSLSDEQRGELREALPE